jgi:transposase-like protein
MEQENIDNQIRHLANMFGLDKNDILPQTEKLKIECPYCHNHRATITVFDPCGHYACPECVDDFADNNVSNSCLFLCSRCDRDVVDIIHKSVNDETRIPEI